MRDITEKTENMVLERFSSGRVTGEEILETGSQTVKAFFIHI